MGQPWHPRCGKRFPAGSRAGHCAVCCGTFIGLSAYDAHLSRDESGAYIHLDPATLPTDAPKNDWWADESGHWHKGARLTDEQKAQMFGAEV